MPLSAEASPEREERPSNRRSSVSPESAASEEVRVQHRTLVLRACSCETNKKKTS